MPLQASLNSTLCWNEREERRGIHPVNYQANCRCSCTPATLTQTLIFSMYPPPALQWLHLRRRHTVSLCCLLKMQSRRSHNHWSGSWCTASKGSALHLLSIKTRTFIAFYFAHRHNSTQSLVQRNWCLIKGTEDERRDETVQLKSSVVVLGICALRVVWCKMHCNTQAALCDFFWFGKHW